MIKIISRKSDLAVIQAEIVANALKQANKDISVSFIKKETEGDIDQLTSLSKLSNIGVFTNDIRESLLNNEADLAVHSLKDLPIEDQKDTLIVSMLERADSRDILFLKKDIFENYNSYQKDTNYSSSVFLVLVLAKELQLAGHTEDQSFRLILKDFMQGNPNKMTWKRVFQTTFNISVSDFYTKASKYQPSIRTVLPSSSLTLESIFN